MNYTEDLRNLIVTEGTYDEDLDMTVIKFEHNVYDTSARKRYLSVMIDEDNNILAGSTSTDSVTIETLSESDVLLLYMEVRKMLTRHRPILMKVTAVVLAVLFFACFALSTKS